MRYSILNQELQDKTLTPQLKADLKNFKAVLIDEENALRQDCNSIKKKTKKLCESYHSLKKNETAIQGERGKRNKPICQGILDLMSSTYGIQMSSYHGGEMEGPSTRLLMTKGREVFHSIAMYLLDCDKSQDCKATDNEITTTCADFANTYVLLDGAISLLNTGRGYLSAVI